MATVVPCTTADTASSRVAVVAARRRTLRTPSMNPSAGLAGVEGVLVVTISPVCLVHRDHVGERASGVDADTDAAHAPVSTQSCDIGKSADPAEASSGPWAVLRWSALVDVLPV